MSRSSTMAGQDSVRRLNQVTIKSKALDSWQESLSIY